MNKTQEKAFCKAATKMFHAYEDLIDDFDNNINNWENYGTIDECRICNVMEVSGSRYDGGDFKENCKKCPLFDCYNKEFDDLDNAISCHKYYGDIQCKESIIKAAKARYKWLIKKIEKAGYVYE